MESWDLDLRASRKSDRTRETYRLAVTQLIDWLKNESRSIELGDITRDDLRGFLLWIMETPIPCHSPPAVLVAIGPVRMASQRGRRLRRTRWWG